MQDVLQFMKAEFITIAAGRRVHVFATQGTDLSMGNVVNAIEGIVVNGVEKSGLEL